MQVVRTIDEAAGLLAEMGRPVIALGTFDGVHQGHQAILGDLVRWARSLDAPATVITFQTHPRLTLTGTSPDMITTVEHRLLLFARLGVDVTIVLTFDEALAQVSAEEFLESYVIGKLAARGLQLGFDSRFGAGGRGTPELTHQVAQGHNLEVRVTGPVLCSEGKPISSTMIRDAIWSCQLERAEQLLGRPVSVLGTVIHGAARGRRMGYRTANLDLNREVRPPYGVYATRARVDGHLQASITNVGSRPTVERLPSDGRRPDLLIETHLFDCDSDLYGKEMEVIFVKKIRDERRFASVDDLVRQIGCDEKAAREILRVQTPAVETTQGKK